MDFSWTDEQILWRKTVRDFAQKKITPKVREIDTNRKIPESIIKDMGKLGLLAVQQLGRPVLQAPALRRLLDCGSFDVIHYNNVSLLGGPHVFRYGTGLKLCTLIEHWLVCPMHVLWKYDREVCTRPSCFLCTVYGKRPPQLWRYTGLMRRATRSIDAFIGPSRFTIEMHRQRGLQGKMIQLPLFHTEPDVKPESASSFNEGTNRRPYFLFVGRLERIKGLQPLFRAGQIWYQEGFTELIEETLEYTTIGRSPKRDALDAMAQLLQIFGIAANEEHQRDIREIWRNPCSQNSFHPECVLRSKAIS